MVSGISGSSSASYAMASARTGSANYDVAMMRKVKENQMLEGKAAVELIESATPAKPGGQGGGSLINDIA